MPRPPPPRARSHRMQVGFAHVIDIYNMFGGMIRNHQGCITYTLKQMIPMPETLPPDICWQLSK